MTGREVSVSGSQDLLTGENNFTVNFSDAVALDVEEQTAMNQAIDDAYPDNKIELVTVSSVSPTMASTSCSSVL